MRKKRCPDSRNVPQHKQPIERISGPTLDKTRQTKTATRCNHNSSRQENFVTFVRAVLTRIVVAT